VEFLFRLPATLKMHDGFGKWILRKAMEPELPPQVAWRTDKIGFEPPQGAWLQGRYAREFVMSRRRELIKNLVVDSDYIFEPIRTSGPHDPENYDWRLLNVASLLFPRLG
jgi:asparagine synthase (glutamine-hydrolysing)